MRPLYTEPITGTCTGIDAHADTSNGTNTNEIATEIDAKIATKTDTDTDTDTDTPLALTPTPTLTPIPTPTLKPTPTREYGYLDKFERLSRVPLLLPPTPLRACQQPHM